MCGGASRRSRGVTPQRASRIFRRLDQWREIIADPTGYPASSECARAELVAIAEAARWCCKIISSVGMKIWRQEHLRLSRTPELIPAQLRRLAAGESTVTRADYVALTQILTAAFKAYPSRSARSYMN